MDQELAGICKSVIIVELKMGYKECTNNRAVYDRRRDTVFKLCIVSDNMTIFKKTQSTKTMTLHWQIVTFTIQPEWLLDSVVV